MKLIVLAPHPDDETIALGGALFDWFRDGKNVHELFVSDGGASHSYLSLTEIRRKEAEKALAALQLYRAATFCGLPDSKLDRHQSDIEAAVVEQLPGRGQRCAVISPLLGDGHADHDAVALAAKSVAASYPSVVSHWSYGVWTWMKNVDHDALVGAQRLTMSAQARLAKRNAINAYRSQVSDDLGQQIVPNELLNVAAADHEVLWCR
jgi:LmbE family N-acetylglucosaminyl deacetylase